MMRALVLAMVINVPWTIAISYFSLMAESGGKEPSPLAAGVAAWALVEIIATALASIRGRVVDPSRTRLAWVLCVLLILRPLLDLPPLPRAVTWQAQGLAVSAVAIACARILRAFMKRR